MHRVGHAACRRPASIYPREGIRRIFVGGRAGPNGRFEVRPVAPEEMLGGVELWKLGRHAIC